MTVIISEMEGEDLVGYFSSLKNTCLISINKVPSSIIVAVRKSDATRK